MYLFVIFNWMMIVTTVEMFQQHDYVIIYERLEVSGYNPNFVKYAKTHNYKYNRTYTATNITLVYGVNFGNQLKIQLQGYKFASNEYRFFPMTFTINLCDSISKDEYGFQSFYDCGNFTRCPMVKGSYMICKWAPSYEKFPPYIPEGSYMLELKYFYRSNEVYGLQLYGTVKHPMHYTR